MRWQTEGKQYPKYGDKRTITKFAFFPIKIGNETRWWQTVTLDQEYITGGVADVVYAEWENRMFVD